MKIRTLIVLLSCLLAIRSNQIAMKHLLRTLMLMIKEAKFSVVDPYGLLLMVDPFYKNNFVPRIMSRNRFQLLLRFVHFADNQGEAVDDRLSKVRKLLEILEKNFTKCRRPGETIAIDETMVHWRGRLIFRQYNPGKAHKYGVKIYKLCDQEGYTYTSYVNAGKDGYALRGRPTATATHSTQIVLDLA